MNFIVSFFQKVIKNTNKQQDNNNPVSIELELAREEIFLAKNCKLVPIDLGMYASPGNDYTNWQTYEVTAINPSTNRKNKRVYKAINEHYVKIQAEKEDLLLKEINRIIPHDEPSEKQLRYAYDLGLNIPIGACKEDVSAMISRVIHYDTVKKEIKIKPDLYRRYVKPLEGPTQELALFACEKGICFSSYISEIALIEQLIYHLDTRDKLAFFMYCVACSEQYKRIGNMNKSTLYSSFYLFADENLNSESVLSSLEKRTAEEFLSPNKKTQVFRSVKKYIELNGLQY